MAARGIPYGYSKQMKDKMDAKYDDGAEAEAMEWIVHHLSERKHEKPTGQKVYLQSYFFKCIRAKSMQQFISPPSGREGGLIYSAQNKFSSFFLLYFRSYSLKRC